MKFSIGDKVVLKHTGEEGHVSAYINEKMIEVDVDGTTFPMHIDDLDHPYLKWFTEKKKVVKKSIPEQLPVEKEQFRKPRLSKGVYLSYLPIFKEKEMEDVVDQLKIYLLNETPYAIHYSYNVRIGDGSLFSHEGKLHEFAHVYLHTIDFGDMNDQPRFNWLVKPLNNIELGEEEGVLRIRPQKLFEQIADLLKKNEPSFSYLLFEDFKPKPKQAKADKYQPVKIQSFANLKTIPREAPKYELDLHIEELVDSTNGLSNADIVQIQLNTLRHYLDLAIMNNQNKMIIVHGIGEGRLRDAVYEVLKSIPEVSHYANMWHGGATEVYFKY